MTDSHSGSASDLIQDGFLRAADQTPDKTALVCADERYTFAQLAERAQNLAGTIKTQLGSDQAQPRIAMALQNSPVVIDVFFATLLAGGHVCLCDPAWPESLLKRILDDHDPDLLICNEEIAAKHQDKAKRLEILTPRILIDLVSSPASTESPFDSRVPIISPDTPFLLGFTSGSSGHPKGFIRNHRTWTESFHHSAIEFNTAQTDCVLAPGPLSHGLSLYAIIEALCAGATAILQPRFDPAALISIINTESVSTIVMVPTMLDVLLEHAKERTFSNINNIVTAGAKLSPNLRTRAKAVCPMSDIIEYYGASELSFVTLAKGSESVPAASVGRPFHGVNIEIRDASGVRVQVGQVGTVWVRSHMLCSGYVGPTDGSGFRTDGDWATVGDLGHCDADGYLFLDGREGAAITSGGYTVYPSAIEATLLSHAFVMDAAVIGVPHPRWGEVIAAAVVPASNAALTEGDLLSHCQKVLEPYACPRQWLITETLARTPSGKIKRDVLVRLFDTK
ncbi:MAG: AMP-binding protein [Rhodospirillaceae bacterium]